MEKDLINNKKLLFVVLWVILFFVISFGLMFFFKDNLVKEKNLDTEEVVEKKEEKKDLATPLLYEVTKEGVDNKIYLFGSIHAADDKAYSMQDKIIEAFNNSEYLAVEVDIVAFQKDIKAQMDMLKLFLCESGKTLKDYLSEESYNIII